MVLKGSQKQSTHGRGFPHFETNPHSSLFLLCQSMEFHLRMRSELDPLQMVGVMLAFPLKSHMFVVSRNPIENDKLMEMAYVGITGRVIVHNHVCVCFSMVCSPFGVF